MNGVFLTDGIFVPASRFRCEQFFPYFRDAGINPTLRYAYGPSYNRAIHQWWGNPYKALCRLRRGVYQVAVPSDTDFVFLQRTAFPQTAAFEKLLARRKIQTFFDFDDSLWVDGTGAISASRKKAFEVAVELADHLIAGNGFLAEQANRPNKTTIIPTVIDTNLYIPPANRSGDEVIIGWMGTAGNFPFLNRVVPALKTVLEMRPQARVKLISNANFDPLLGVDRVEQIPWTAAEEIAQLQSFDIGLMPLVDSPLTRGKCAFKMIQYMSVGAPVVVSNVGANAEVFGKRELGYLLDDFDWVEALITLIDDATLRTEMGKRGRQRAVENYSITAVLPTYITLFEATKR